MKMREFLDSINFEDNVSDHRMTVTGLRDGNTTYEVQTVVDIELDAEACNITLHSKQDDTEDGKTQTFRYFNVWRTVTYQDVVIRHTDSEDLVISVGRRSSKLGVNAIC